MKIKFLMMLIFSLVFFNTTMIWGQEKAITKAEFIKNTENYYLSLRDKSYRSITTNKTFNIGNSTPINVSKTIYEVIPPHKSRSIYESDKEKIEEITIGPRTFIRVNDGKWKRKDDNDTAGGIGCGSQILYESYKVTKNTKLNGKSVNLYEKTMKTGNSSCGSGSSSNGTRIWTERFWITKENLFLKVENENEDVEAKTMSRRSTIYQYSPKKLKIEAPIK
jgi:hypothetical protein